MTLEIVLVLLIVGVAVLLFVTEKLRMDAVAVLVLASLCLTGLVTPEQALSGFSNPATITVAAMFVLAAGLQNSGALSGLGAFLARAKSPFQFLLLLFAVLAVIAPFVNNTAVVAVFMPLVIAATASIGMPASKALIPLSFVSQMAGVCTLVGTSTNLLVNSIAKEQGHPGFTMFEFAPLGLICMAAGCLYLLTVGRWLLPATRTADMEDHYNLGKFITELRVMPDSPLVGSSVADAKLGEEHGVYVLELLREDEKVWSPRAQLLQAGDVLLARGDWTDLENLLKDKGLEVNTQFRFKAPMLHDVSRAMVEVMVAPGSRMVGTTLASHLYSWQHDAMVLAVQRRGEILREQLKDVTLNVGDILLLIAPESSLPGIKQDKNVIVLSERDAPKPKGWRAPFALVTMALVIGVAAAGWAPIAVTAMVGAVAMALAGCLDTDSLYETVDWRIIVVMAGLLPLGIAMSRTGAAEFIVQHTIGWVQSHGPHVVLAVLYLVALLLAETMSNSAAAVLLTPIGMSTAQLLDADPTPFLIAVTFSASTSFLTPVGYQTNTMVYSAGGYRFMDFLKVGLPLNAIFWVLGVIFIPIFWPF